MVPERSDYTQGNDAGQGNGFSLAQKSPMSEANLEPSHSDGSVPATPSDA